MLRVILRRGWLVALVFVGAIVASGLGIFASWFGSSHPVDALVLAATAGLIVGLFTRVGLLAGVAALLPSGTYLTLPAPGAEVSAWYAPTFYVPLLLLLALQVWTFRLTLGARALWRDDLGDA